MRNYFPLNHASRESLKYANKLSFGRYISSELKKVFIGFQKNKYRKIWLFDEVVFLDHFLHFLKLRFNAFQFFPPLPMHLTLCQFGSFGFQFNTSTISKCPLCLAASMGVDPLFAGAKGLSVEVIKTLTISM